MKETITDGGWYGGSAGMVVARHNGNVELVVIPKMEKEIIAGHGDCAWMALARCWLLCHRLLLLLLLLHLLLLEAVHCLCQYLYLLHQSSKLLSVYGDDRI